MQLYARGKAFEAEKAVSAKAPGQGLSEDQVGQMVVDVREVMEGWPVMGFSFEHKWKGFESNMI